MRKASGTLTTLSISLLRCLVSVQDEEISSLLHAFCGFFFVLAAYFMCLPLRDEAGLSLGKGALPGLFVASLIVTLVAAPASSSLLTQQGLPKGRTLQRLYRFFSASLLVYFALYTFFPEPELESRGEPSWPLGGSQLADFAFLFVRGTLFLWVSLLNLFTVSAMWALLADVLSSEAAARLFGFVGAGATFGQLVGSLAAGAFASSGAGLLLAAAGLMELAARCAVGIHMKNEALDTGLGLTTPLWEEGERSVASGLQAAGPRPSQLAGSEGAIPALAKRVGEALQTPPCNNVDSKSALPLLGLDKDVIAMKMASEIEDNTSRPCSAVARDPQAANAVQGSAASVREDITIQIPARRHAFQMLMSPSSPSPESADSDSKGLSSKGVVRILRASRLQWNRLVRRGMSFRREGRGQFGKAIEGFRLIWASSYLCYVSGFLLLTAGISSLFYFERMAVVAGAANDPVGRRQLIARINSISALATVIFQLSISGRLLALTGVAGALCAAPSVALSGMMAIALYPTPLVVASAEATRKVVGYVLTRPGREVLFTVISREEKYSAKVTIDTLVQRLGDATAAGVYHVLASWLHLGPAGVAAFSVPVCVLWIVVGLLLGSRHRQLARSAVGL